VREKKKRESEIGAKNKKRQGLTPRINEKKKPNNFYFTGLNDRAADSRQEKKTGDLEKHKKNAPRKRHFWQKTGPKTKKHRLADAMGGKKTQETGGKSTNRQGLGGPKTVRTWEQGGFFTGYGHQNRISGETIRKLRGKMKGDGSER